MNKSDFRDWKQHPVTQIVYSQLKHRIQELYEILGEQAGLNPLQDRELVGCIKAYNDVLLAEYEDEEESK